MAVIEITCPHCTTRTYVTFVRQTGSGSCPECGNEISNVFQYSSNPVSGEGTLLTEDFNPAGATIIAGAGQSGDGQDPYGDAPADSLPTLDLSLSGPSLMSVQSAPVLDPSQSKPALEPSQSAPVLDPSLSGPALAPAESAPMLVPSNSAPTLLPNASSASARAEGILLTPPPPRLRQFANEDAKSTRTKRPTAEINLEQKTIAEPAEDSPTRPTLPPVPVSVPGRSSQTRSAVRRPTGSIASAPDSRRPVSGTPASVSPAPPQRAPTGTVQKSPTGSIQKPPAPTRRPTGSIGPAPDPGVGTVTRRPTSPLPTREISRPVAAPPALPTRRATSPLPSREITRPMAAPTRRPTAGVSAPRKPTAAVNKGPGSIAVPAMPLPLGESLAPAEEISLFTPPPPKAPGTRAMPPAAKAPGTRAQPQTPPESGGRSYAPIRVPGGPPSSAPAPRPPAAPPRTPTRKLTVVGLGEAPRLAAPEKPKDFAKPKFDASLTRLGYTMPGSDVSHFDLPAPSPVPFGVSLPEGDGEEPPVAPGPKPGTRAAMPRPSGPVPKPPAEEYEAAEGEPAAPGPKPGTRATMQRSTAPVPKPPTEDYDVLADEPGVDIPASMVSKVEINAEWAPSGPDSGVIGKVEIPGDLDDLDDEVDSSAATTVPEGDASGDDEVIDDEFEAEAETRQLPKQEKKKPRKPVEDPTRQVYHSRPQFDWEKFRYHLFIGTIYTVCGLALVAFALALYHVHVKPLF